MKKSITSLLLLLALTVLFVSCTPSEEQEETPAGENAVWGAGIDTYLVVDSNDWDVYGLPNKLQSYITSVSGEKTILRDKSDDSMKHIVSLGDTGTAISKKAYQALDDVFNASSAYENGTSSWLIYAESGSLAIAYTDTLAKIEAVNYVMTRIKDSAYEPARGLVYSGSFDTRERLDVLRDESRKEELVYVEETLGKGAADALMRLYSLYDEELYVWLANLYCPDVGGFYYSNSARDNEGFLPDLESTYQALAMLGNSGIAQLYRNPISDDLSYKWAAMLPYEIGENILAFAKSLQEPDGYFYHPQWGTGISSSRRGRDAGCGKRIILAMGSNPNYTIKYDVDPTSSLHPVTDKLGGSTVVAVSKVVATAAVSDSEKYSSEANFIAYLEELFASGNSYSAGNTINATIGAIQGHGLRGTLCNWLIDKQNPENGLWEDEVTYQSVNGLMKLCGVFGGDYPSFPNPERALDSAMEIMKRPIDDGLDAITTVYNPWVAMYNLLNRAGEEKKAELRKELYANSREIFTMMAQKLALFKKSDGGFSYNLEFSAAYSQDALVAVSGSAESDVNATTIAISTVARYMSKVFGITFPEVYSEYDSIYFLETMDRMYSIVKNRMEEPEVETFDDFVPADSEYKGNVVINPGKYVTNNIGDMGGNVWFESNVVQNPKSDEHDLVLWSADRTYPDSDKKIATEASRNEFKISNFASVGNCYVFEADMLFSSVEDASAPLAQLTFVREGSKLITAWVDFYQYERFGQKYIRIQDYLAGADGVKDTEVVAGLPVDEWFNLRVEMYKEYTGESSALNITLKFYVNGTLAGISDSAQYEKGAYKDFVVSAIRLSYYRHTPSEVYLNNVLAAKTGQSYSYEGMGGVDDTPVSDKKHVYGFDNEIPNSDAFFGEMFYKHEDHGLTSVNPSDWTDSLDKLYGTKGGVKLYHDSDPESDVNKVIRAYSQNTESSAYDATLYVQEQLLAEGGTTWEIEFDYYFEKLKWIFADKFFTLELQNTQGSSIASLSFNGLNWKETNNTDRLGISLSNGKTLDNIVLSDATWYTFKVVYHYDSANPEDSMILIYVLSKDGYVCVANEKVGGKAGVIDRVGFNFHCYKIRGTQYIDDVSVSRTDLKYVNEEVVEGEIELPDMVDNKIYVDTSSRGEGKYVNEAISYENKTFEQLVKDKKISTSVIRGDGVADGNRELGTPLHEGNKVLYYSTLASGNHAFEFMADKPAMEGMIFETDIKLVGVDAESGRDIRFTATSTAGAADADVWCFNLKIHKNPNEKIGGYIVTVSGSDKKVVIKDSQWYNLRLVAGGVDADSPLSLYVNGTLVIETTLGEDGEDVNLKGAVGVELYTPATYGGQGWERGGIYLDNTYVGGLGTPPKETTVQSSSRGEGEYLGSAVTYEGITYEQLLSGGIMVNNLSRGDGVEAETRELLVNNTEADKSYLSYKSLGSGIHSLNFACIKGVYTNLVFETDIKLSGVDNTQTRPIRFVASVYNGIKDADSYAFALNIYANRDEDVGGYVVTVSGSYDKVYIKDDTWVNLRLVASGLDKGSALQLFVNGDECITTTLTGKIPANVKGVELYTPSSYNGAHGWENGEIQLDNTYVGGFGDAPEYPAFTESYRDKGENKGNAINYSSTTYEQLISKGYLAQNTYRTDGIEAGNRTLSIKEIGGNVALVYSAVNSGNNAINFKSQATAYTGFVFETDLMLDGVNCDKERAIAFTGTYNNGKGSADLWALNIKIYKNPEISVGGYILTVGSYSCRIAEKAWVNIRFEAKFASNNGTYSFYVNGEKVVTDVKLSSNMSAIKGVELYTASTSGGIGFTEGMICLDNTYVSGIGEAPEYDRITSSQRGEGEYKDYAISYEGVTFEQLINDGKMAENTYRTEGLADNKRTLSFETVSDSAAMVYKAVASAYCGMNFVKDTTLSNKGFVFETDIMLDGISNDISRPIAFVGSNNTGTNTANLWGLNIKLYKNLNASEGGYVIELSGTEWKGLIPEATWVNIRFEAEETAKGSSFSFYVNGVKVTSGALTGAISSLKSVELSTPSNSGGYGFVSGAIYLDNTYAGSIIKKPSSDTSGGQHDSGNMDGDAWDD